MHSAPSGVQGRADQPNAVITGFLGCTRDAFAFSILVLVSSALAKDFHSCVPAIVVTVLLWLIVNFGPEAKRAEFVRSELPLAKGAQHESAQSHSEIGTYCSTNLK